MKLVIENLTAGYDADVVLQDLSLSVKEGEFLSNTLWDWGRGNE